MIVRVTVAGKPANFILDTRDELTLLDREFFGFAKPERKKSEAPGGHGILTCRRAIHLEFSARELSCASRGSELSGSTNLF